MGLVLILNERRAVRPKATWAFFEAFLTYTVRPKEIVATCFPLAERLGAPSSAALWRIVCVIAVPWLEVLLDASSGSGQDEGQEFPGKI